MRGPARKTDLIVLPMVAVAAITFWLRDHVGLAVALGFVLLLGAIGIGLCIRGMRRA